MDVVCFHDFTQHVVSREKNVTSHYVYYKMASKAEYLKKYLSGESDKKKKKRRKMKKESNVVIHDDDVDWKSLVPEDQAEVYEDDDPGKMFTTNIHRNKRGKLCCVSGKY